MNAFTEASRLVGYTGPTITEFPTHADIIQATEDQDLVSLLEWNRRLRPPANRDEAELAVTIARTVLEMTPEGHLAEVAVSPCSSASSSDPVAVPGEYLPCIVCATRHSATAHEKWLAIAYGKRSGICTNCAQHIGTAQLWGTFHKERPALAEQAAEIILYARRLHRLQPTTPMPSMEDTHVDY